MGFRSGAPGREDMKAQTAIPPGWAVDGQAISREGRGERVVGGGWAEGRQVVVARQSKGCSGDAMLQRPRRKERGARAAAAATVHVW